MGVFNKTILVTGGAGYIGSHFVHFLRKHTESQIVIVDNFSESENRKNKLGGNGVCYYETDINDRVKLDEIFRRHKIEVVVHYAAFASVPDSVVRPQNYYKNNIVGGLVLLDTMLAHGVNKMIFSSSSSVYGEPVSEVISEDHPKNPINPYGYTKLAFEKVLQDYHRAYGLSSISFRYFCAAGCDESGEIGEYHTPETHAIPCILETILKKREKFFVYGNDYPTPDGTGIRDYIHVNDLASAHFAGLQKLMEGKPVCSQYNLGINKGFSVMELIKAAEHVSGQKVAYEVKPRRPGDPSRLIADSSKAQAELCWTPRYMDIKDIIRTAYEFFKIKK